MRRFTAVMMALLVFSLSFGLNAGVALAAEAAPSAPAAAPQLTISPPDVTVVTTTGKQPFSASGGTGSVTWGFATDGNKSGGSIDPTTGAYVAGSTGGVVDTVTATDSATPPITATATVHVKWTTNVTLRCNPYDDTVGNPMICEGTVNTVGSPDAPTGTLTWSAKTGDPPNETAAAGSWDNTVCTLAAGKCEATFTPTAIPPKNQIHITAQYSGDTIRQQSNGNIFPNISAGKQAITFAELAPQTYGVADFSVSASASSGLPVSFSARSQCTVGPSANSSATVHITGAGTCTVTASQSGDGNWTPATPVSQTFNINKATLTVTANNAIREYGAANPTPLTGTITGVVSGDNITATYSTTATATSPVGPYAVTATLADPNTRLANYNVTNTAGSLNVTQAPLTVITDNKSKVYGDANPELTGTITGTKNGDAITATRTTTAVVTSGVANYPITAALSDPGTKLGNYVVSNPGGTLTITTAPGVTVKVNDATRPYGAANPDFTSSIDGARNGDQFTVNYSTGATVDSGVGTYPITATLSGAAVKNYADPSIINGSLTITRAPATIKVIPPPGAVYDGNTKPATATTTPANLGPVTFTYSTRGGQPSSTPPTDAGHYHVVATLNDPNHAPASDAADFDIALANQTITFAELPNKTFGDPDFPVSATVNSPLAVTFAAAGNCQLLPGNMIHLTGAGSCTVTASQGGNHNYNPASDVIHTFKIAQASQTITFDPLTDKTYGDADFTVSAHANSGLPVTFSVGATDKCTVGPSSNSSATIHLTGAGPCTVTASQGGDNDWTAADSVSQKFTISRAKLTVTAPTSPSRFYGDPNPPVTGSIDGIKNSDNITAIYTSTAMPSSPPDNYPLTATLSDPDGRLVNYDVTLLPGSLTVIPAPLTVTTDNKSKVYGAVMPELGCHVTGLKNGDVITATCSTTADATSGVGGYHITATLHDDGNKLGNYTVSNPGGTLTITMAPGITVTVNDTTRAYGAADHLTGTPTGIKNNDQISITYSTTATATSGPGPYPITAALSGEALKNYGEPVIINGTLTITPADASITLTAPPELVYDGKQKTATATTVPAGLPVTVTYTPAGGQVSSTTPPTDGGTYHVVATLNDKNYQADPQSADFTITPANQDITFAPLSNMTYGDVPLHVSATASSGLPVTFSVGATDQCTLSNGDTLTITGAGSCTVTASQEGNGNYNAAAPVPRTFTINKANQTVTFAENTPRVKTYGDPDFTVSASANTPLAVTYAAAGDCSVHADTGLVHITGAGDCTITATQGGNDNYNPTHATAVISIGKANLTVTANNLSREYGTPNPDFTATFDGLVNNDQAPSLTFSTDATITSDVGTYDIIASNGIPQTFVEIPGNIPSDRPPGLAWNNYNVTWKTGTLTVTQALLTVKAVIASKVYGQDNPALTGVVNGARNHDAFTAECSTIATKSSPVGDYDITCTAIATNGKVTNYTITGTTAKLTVLQASTNITLSVPAVTTQSGSLTVTATLTSNSSLAINEGTVVFTTSGLTTSASSGPVPVTNGVAHYTFPLTGAAGNASVIAQYSGTNNFSMATIEGSLTVSSVFINPPPPTVQPFDATVKVVAPPTAAAGSTINVTATVLDTAGATVPAFFTWTVSGGTITASGAWTLPTKADTYIVKAQAFDPNNHSRPLTNQAGANLIGQSTVDVGPDLGHIKLTISPADPQTVQAGSSLGFTYTAVDQYGNAITDAATWSVTGVGSVTGASDNKGQFSATKTGTAVVTVTVAGATANSGQITVTAGAAAQLTVSGPTSLATGATGQYTAVVTDKTGNVVPGAAFTWSATGGTITGAGAFTAPATSGYITITATAGGLSGSLKVKIGSGISIDGPTQVYMFNLAQYTASGFDGTVTWSASGGTINGQGAFTAPGKAGKVTITATGGDASASLDVTIVPLLSCQLGGDLANMPPDIAAHWADPYIVKLLQIGVVNGFPDGTFRPDSQVTRFQLAKILAVTLCLDVEHADLTVLNRFADKASIPDWAAKYVAAVVTAGAMVGTDRGFDGNLSVTRDQMATVVGRLLTKVTPATLTFTDADSIPGWARDGVARSVAAGIVSGYPDGSFRPGATLTRGEIAKIIYLTIQALVTK